jgi:dihydroxy-acid dehydratase
LDIPGRRLEVQLTKEEMDTRRAGWKPLEPKYTTGVFAKYARLVSSASEGAVTR